MRVPRLRAALAAGALATMVVAAPVAAITNGQPDAYEHPHVGQLFFFLPDANDPRFDDPGGWANCSGTLISPTVVVTAGHCTFGTGLDGGSTLEDGGAGGNDVWITFRENVLPFYDKLPPSLSFGAAGQQARYDAWTKLLNDPANGWVRGTAYPHPDYDDNAFYLHDAGVVILDKPIPLGTAFDAGHPITEYGTLPEEDFLDQFIEDSKLRRTARFEPVGYGVELSYGYGQFGGDTRMKADSKLINDVVLGFKGDDAVGFSNNNGKVHKGGTCNGDSGGPIFVSNDTTIVAVNSFGISGSCKGVDGGYRLDQPDDLEWLHEVLAAND